MTVQSAVEEGAWSGRVSPADVHGMVFPRARIGRRGYDEAEVDAFLERVAAEITRLIREKADLRDETQRLRSLLASEEGPAADGVPRDEATVQAVRILSTAQQTADQYVAEAESYSRSLSLEAREHCEQLVDDARRRAQVILESADRIAAAAATSARGSGTADGCVDAAEAKQDLEEQVAYLRTFSEVCRVQLRSYLEALLQDIEQEWGRAQPEAMAALVTLPRGRTGTEPVVAPQPRRDELETADGAGRG